MGAIGISVTLATLDLSGQQIRDLIARPVVDPGVRVNSDVLCSRNVPHLKDRRLVDFTVGPCIQAARRGNNYVMAAINLCL